MKRLPLRFVANIILDLLLLSVCLVHLPSVLQRSKAPFEVAGQDGAITVAALLDPSASGGLRTGDVLKAWNGVPIELPQAVEFLGDMGSIGETVTVASPSSGAVRSLSVTLIPYYPSPRFLIISAIVGLLIWCTSVVLLYAAPQTPSSLALHWSLMAFAATILMTLGSIAPEVKLRILDRALFFLAYGGVAPLFFFFTLLYPRRRVRRIGAAAVITFVPALLLIAGLAVYQLSDLSAGSALHASAFQKLFALLHVSLFVYLGGALANLVVVLRSGVPLEERKRIQWILWGLAIGSAPFLFLHVLPQLVFAQYLIPEEYATVFFAAIPFSFAMSLLKYRFLDIELLINRSIVYALLSGFVLLMFGVIFFLVTTALGMPVTFREYLLLALTTLALAVLFLEVRGRLQRFVDETLFAARSHFRSALRHITDRLHSSMTLQNLYDSMAEELFELLRSRTIAVYSVERGALRLKVFRGEAPERQFPVWSLPDDMRQPAEGARAVTSGDEGPAGVWLARRGWSACCSMVDEQNSLTTLVLVALRSVGDPMREEETDMLATVCLHASDVAGRLSSQERAILAQEERRRLQELSDLKSYFVSSVSHELKMPLTSIRMFAEIMNKRRSTLNAREAREYLEIIEGESDRLTRLIENILDFSRIERGTKEYSFNATSVGEVVRRSVTAMQYEFRKHGATLRVHCPGKLPEIDADRDALEETILNLLSNAVKYSPGKKVVTLTVKATGAWLDISIADKGMGISKLDLPHVFEEFYRGRSEKTRHIGGMGLGLPLARHITEAHGGRMMVKSTVGKGSTFTIRLPRKRKDGAGS